MIKDFLRIAVVCAVMGAFVIVGLNATLEEKFASIDQRFESIEERLEKIEDILADWKMIGRN